MIFTSLLFLAFFVAVLLAMWLVPGRRTQLMILLAASYVFYGAWNWTFVPLIVAVSLVGYVVGLLLERAQTKGLRRLIATFGIALSLLPLAYYKYANFIVDNLRSVDGLHELRALDILLPVGISFFTFQSLSYVIDVYRRRLQVCHSALEYLLFVAFFPQLVAGPIVRASEFLPQLKEPVRLRLATALAGGQLFLGGLIQKSLIADNLSTFVDPVFADPQLFAAPTLLLGMLAYGTQIFCDFSGYSLMAIGVARVLGFELPVNFRMPYVASSVTEFWHRWHISLSTWLRDYLYKPLGGSRRGPLRTRINLLLTMVLGGIWHGASWNFVLWGFLHGAALIIQKDWSRIAGQRFTERFGLSWKLLAWAVTFAFVMLAWVPFRCIDFPTTLAYFEGLTRFDEGIVWWHTTTLLLLLLTTAWHLLYLAGARALLVFPHAEPARAYPLLVLASAIVVVLLGVPLDASPFLYFQF